MKDGAALDGVDVWFVCTRDVRDPALLEACASLLTPSEQERSRGFVFEKHRHEYLVTRALARAVLAPYVGTTPDALEFVRNEYGRPELSPPSVRFNLTNTTDLVACIVARGREVGIDAEPLSRAETILGIAPTVFTEGELSTLAALPLPARHRRAVELWTLKEAYIKARGMGMSLPVEKIELQIEPGAIGLRFFEPVSDVTEWDLGTREIDGHLIATCVERGGSIRTRRADLGELLGLLEKASR